jgi:ABC-type uncharacterized transport system permease subunit
VIIVYIAVEKAKPFTRRVKPVQPWLGAIIGACIGALYAWLFPFALSRSQTAFLAFFLALGAAPVADLVQFSRDYLMRRQGGATPTAWFARKALADKPPLSLL